MMNNIGAVSYALACAAFLILSILLVTSWKGRLQGALLVVASLMSAAWAALLTYYAAYSLPSPVVLLIAEVIRDIFWCVFLLKLLSSTVTVPWYAGRLRLMVISVTVIGAGVMLLLLLPGLHDMLTASGVDTDSRLVGITLLTITGLVIVEQLLRNSNSELRWALKYMYLGIGGIFVYDFILYSNALLYQQVDDSLWQARGIINALAVPLLIVSASRNPQWSVEVFVSRGVTFHTTALLGAGIYLLAMSAGGYYIREYGGSWGVVAQAVFLFTALSLLVLIIFSGHMRARLKVFINKHFYQYNYDYREEWRRLIRTLSSGKGSNELYEKAVIALADIVDSHGGGLWLRRESGCFEPVATYGVAIDEDARLPIDSPLTGFITEREWIIDVQKFPADSASDTLALPDWVSELGWPWLIVPLIHHQMLFGFIILAQPRSARHINWEDRDLLKTAGRQIASHLAQLEASQALVHAQQFEAVNRLSTFMIHDLKNLTAQLSLVVSNAQRHKHNAAFVDDMIETVGHAVEKMNHLLGQLRVGKTQPLAMQKITALELLLQEVIKDKSVGEPVPVLRVEDAGVMISVDPQRLSTVLGHLIQNAQDATAADGRITIVLRRKTDQAVIEISDTGCGMETRFIRERLFRPFDTTKGAGGMGIGVYQSREFIRDMGGEITVSSEVNVGTQFCVMLPLLAVSEEKLQSVGN